MQVNEDNIDLANTSEEDVASSKAPPTKPKQLFPLRPILVIAESGPSDLPPEEISSERVGWKAYGLSSLPPEWVPPFFVITAPCLEGRCSEEMLEAWVAECATSIGIGKKQKVFVRSSGTFETMRNRGRLISASCEQLDVGSTIRNLTTRLGNVAGGQVHWIIQWYVSPKEKGHLSNERHLSREKRDWIAEFEPQAQDEATGYRTRIAIRRWRDGTNPTNIDLSCASKPEVTLRLRRVAMWADQFPHRTHFEWVWDGEAVRIVQADVAEVIAGVNPRSFIPARIIPIEPTSLKVFHPVTKEDYEQYGKLRNAKVYGEFGYNMPAFYVLDEPKTVSSILSGHIPDNLESDLSELTKRPLIIRTDGANIPTDKREMLPRSEELRSCAEARNWLLVHFKSQIEQSQLQGSSLCLIAHHFVPAIASAWARAEPGKRMVRIEALWGIPEGLYWYSHDTFEVDTQTLSIDPEQLVESLSYRYWDRLRYKGTFIAPDESGKWVPYQTRRPYDWKASIGKPHWLFEIARTTRLIAEYEKHAVSVMWFIDTHSQATDHRVLPWFHSKSELGGHPKAAPRHKRKSGSDFSIKTVEDWQQLHTHLRSGIHIERVIVEPVDPNLIRNPQFAQELAGLAASEKFVVQLSGGILSHAYYILRRSGAQVECLDLFGTDEDVVEYNKVVRDKIPRIIERGGERVETVQLAGDALVTALRQKLVEESFEALDAKSGDEIISELADVEEVIRALCQALKVPATQLEAEREEKLKRRGGFEKGLMLIKTATPHSIQQQPPIISDSPALALKSQQTPEPVISQVTDLPTKPMYRRPDLRHINQLIEKLFTFETETNRIGEVKETLTFSIPIDKEPREFTLTVELRRTRSSVRGVIRLRLLPSQLEIKFPVSQLNIEFPE